MKGSHECDEEMRGGGNGDHPSIPSRKEGSIWNQVKVSYSLSPLLWGGREFVSTASVIDSLFFLTALGIVVSIV